jgi:NDP-sugar pyrophosphorylase family protein
MQDVTVNALLDTTHTIAAPLFEGYSFAWEVLPKIKAFVVSLGMTLDGNQYNHPSENVWISKSATVAPTASISGPAIICAGAEIRHCAYIRGSVIVGEGAVVGNSCELKNCILFDRVQVPHFNYVGDSILGYLAHMGAGAITSNVKSDKSLVSVHDDGIDIETGLKKFGAIVGDMAEIGCNCVLNPGTIVGRNSNIYPLTSVRGVVPPDSIMKGRGNIVRKHCP